MRLPILALTLPLVALAGCPSPDTMQRDVTSPEDATSMGDAVDVTIAQDASDGISMTDGGPTGAILTPGAGFTGPSPAPAAVGAASEPGHDATAIARWDVVPYQRVDGRFEVGVIAFHLNGIDRVEFSVDDGPWIAVHEMTLNPRTGVWEYWVTLDASSFGAGREVELRAVAYPTNGVPRLLADGSASSNDAGDRSLRLEVVRGGAASPTAYVASTGSDTTGTGTQAQPYATLQHALDALPNLDGATIFLGEGSYSTPNDGESDNTEWLTVTATPGADPARVILTGSDGARWNTRRIRLHHLAITPRASEGGGVVNPSRSNRIVWFDDVTIDGTDREIATGPTVNQADTYWTDVTIREYANPVDTWNGDVLIARHVHVQGALEDPFRVRMLLVDSSVDDVNERNSSAHPDIIQAGDRSDNFIVYGLRATNAAAQGIYIDGSNWALVNILIQQPGASGYLWQIDNGITDHVLVWNVTTIGQTLEWRNGENTSAARNVSVRNSAFEAMAIGPSSQGFPTDEATLLAHMRIDNNHFTNGPQYGMRATLGDPRFANANVGDFRPGASSPLRNRVDAVIVPVDLAQHAIAPNGAIGALQP